MTAALGVNDDEIGVVVKRGAGHAVRRRGDHPAGVRLGPRAAASTRSTGSPTPGCWPGSRSRPPGTVTWRDLTALPCSHPHCCSVGYLLRDDSGTLAVADVADRARPAQGSGSTSSPTCSPTGSPTTRSPRALRAVVKDSLLDLLSEQSSLSHPSMATIWKDICENCDLGIGTLPRSRPRAARAAQAAAADARGAGAPGHGEAVHGHEHDDRGAAHPVLRARRRPSAAGRRPPVRAVLRRAGVGAAGAQRSSPPSAGRSRTSLEEPRHVDARRAPRETAGRRRRTTRCGCASSRPSRCWAGCSGRWRCSASRCWGWSATRGPTAPG